MLKLALLATVASAAKPVVELSLASSMGPAASAVAGADAKLSGGFASDFAQLDAAYTAVLSKASVSLGSTIASAMGRASFATNIVEPTIAVKVVGGSSDDAAATAGVSAVESKRAAGESALVAGAKAEMEELARVVISEFNKQIRAHRGSFLRFSRGINVRLVSESAATFANSLTGLEAHRDQGEDAVRAKILSLEMALVQSLNRIGGAALGVGK